MNINLKQGYYRYPNIWNNQIIFVSEDNLWHISLSTKYPFANKISTNIGIESSPKFSKDGKNIAFISSQEGNKEVYCMPTPGGEITRLTYLGIEGVNIIGWRKNKIIITTSSLQPFSTLNDLFLLDPKTKQLTKIIVGPSNNITFKSEETNICVIQRNGGEYSYWKRYKGGAKGELWIDDSGKNNFKKLIELNGNLSSPIWVQDKIYFLSDHDGIGSIYSCNPNGKNLIKEKQHKTFYIRNISSDDKNIIYTAGSDIYIFNIKNKESNKINFAYYSSKPQCNLKLINTKNYLEKYSIHPKGHHILISARGNIISLPNWSGAPTYIQTKNHRRYREANWLYDGKHIITIGSEKNHDILEIYQVGETSPKYIINNQDIGHIVDIITAPEKYEFIITNQKGELIYIKKLKKQFIIKIIDKSDFSAIKNIDWSINGNFIAYSSAISPHISIIKIIDLKNNNIHSITQPILQDINPNFSPCGKYLYFLGKRQFKPTYDILNFNLSFQTGIKPYLILLKKNILSPFAEKIIKLSKNKNKQEINQLKLIYNIQKKFIKKTQEEFINNLYNKFIPELKKTNSYIDFDGIKNRIIPFPMNNGIYEQIIGIKNHVLLTKKNKLANTLISYNIQTKTTKEIANNVINIQTNSLNKKWGVYLNTDGNIKIIKNDEKIEDNLNINYEQEKAIDLSRIDLTIKYKQEWFEIFHEAWRLQKDFFWSKNMSNVNWENIKKKYEPLLNRIGSRLELTDLLWEMQGELGTSHAYVIGGDLKKYPVYKQGLLGAKFIYNKKYKAYHIKNIIKGESWNPNNYSPLTAPGNGLKDEDLIYSINGRILNEKIQPEMLLINSAEKQVLLGIISNNRKKSILIKPNISNKPAHYRDWVLNNRNYVHKKSNGAIGYIHIPDMSTWGYAEFHRSFLYECDKYGLIIDARFNTGGHISSLILEKLSRKRLGYDISRWQGCLPYPIDSSTKVMVAMANEHTGSDGDMFSHGFKTLKLGPLIGKKTWGGVIGIEPKYFLSDHGITTQPEYSFWFKDIGWKIENFGVKPDIEIENKPQDYIFNQDQQLNRAIIEVNNIALHHKEKLPNKKLSTHFYKNI